VPLHTFRTRNLPLGFILTLYLEPFKQDRSINIVLAITLDILITLAALGKTPSCDLIGRKFFAYVHKPNLIYAFILLLLIMEWEYLESL
jgi:hypothetical protein